MKQFRHLCLREPHGLVFYTHFQPDFAFRLVKHDFAPVLVPDLVGNLNFILFAHFYSIDKKGGLWIY
jgi:hypothetical protein